MISMRRAANPARLIGVSRTIRLLILALVAAVAGGLAVPASAKAPATPTLREYPMPPRAMPAELSAKAQAALPKVERRVVAVIGDDMDQAALMPVQVVSALYIRRAFRKPLGSAAWHSALRISWRESRLLPNVVNDTNTDGTMDWGLFQLNDGGTLQFAGGVPGPDVLRPRWNARAAASIVAQVGWGPWGGML